MLAKSNDALLYWLVNGAPDVTYEEHLFLKRKEAFGTGETETFEDYDAAVLQVREVNVEAREAHKKKIASLTEQQLLGYAVERTRQRERGRPMEVYFLRECGLGCIKIGVSTNVTLRIRALSNNMPQELVLLATMAGGYEVEAVLHGHFAHARVRGEWFRPIPELLGYIAEIRSGEPPKDLSCYFLEASP